MCQKRQPETRRAVKEGRDAKSCDNSG
jgi:hypothetical protein